MLVDSHIAKTLIEGSTPKPPECRISSCGYAFCERFERLRQNGVAFGGGGANCFIIMFLKGAVSLNRSGCLSLETVVIARFTMEVTMFRFRISFHLSV